MPEKQFKTPKIVHPGSGRPFWLYLFAGLAVAALTWFAYQHGQRQAGFFQDRSSMRQAALSQQVEELQAELEKQRERAARFERASQIDRLAAEQVRGDLKTLQQERSELVKKVAFLNSLVSGEMTMLQVSKVELSKQEQQNAYTFSFLVSKRAKGDERVSGQVRLQVAGKLKGEDTVLEPQKMGLGKAMKMGFRHFQKFEGKLQLPEGFIPRELVVVGEPKGKKFKSFEHRTEWKLS